jgi:hypothetical protein
MPDSWLMYHSEGLAGVAGVSSPLGVCSGRHPIMTARNPRSSRESELQYTGKAVSKFWQECDRYHDLAEQFARDIVITHPNGMSGRHPSCPGDTECCGWCATGVNYYEHISKARYSSSAWH